ncbi:MAG: FRG domain-containing protein [Leptospiraceae bacterium]|nr:FRG domain-containing protein [Leptospiraceae bacterium]
MTKEHKFEHDEEIFENWIDFRNHIFGELDDTINSLGIVFRGHSNHLWDLQPTIYRIRKSNEVDKHESISFIQELNDLNYLRRSLHLFTKEFNIVNHKSSNIDLLSILQHHGAATRLLDFSISPFIASFFALTDINKKGNYACVWKLSLKLIDEVNKFLLNIEDNDPYNFLYNLYNSDILVHNKHKKIIGYSFLERPSIRPFQQKSGFIFPMSIDNNLENLIPQYNTQNNKLLTKYKIRISEENIQSAFKDFSKMNISFANLFPGLDGFCKDILMRQYADWY